MLEGQDFTAHGRLAQFVRMIEAFERNDVETAVDLLIERLDTADGDPDDEPDGTERDIAGHFAYASPYRPDDRLAEHRDADIALKTEDDEDNGDERDGNASEDDWMHHGHNGPGCPIADAGGTDEDNMADRGWTEWHTRGRHKLDQGAELVGRDRFGNLLQEDAEDDDPAEDDDSDRCEAGDDHMIAGPVTMRDYWLPWAFKGHEIGNEDDKEPVDEDGGAWSENGECGGPIEEGDNEEDITDLIYRRPTRDRVRRARCDRVGSVYRLRDNSGRSHAPQGFGAALRHPR